MTESAPGDDLGADDLTLFGFDDDVAERWMDHFRGAGAPPSLGTLGPYEILAEIDRGGQGVVYRARQPGLKRQIALKRLRAGSLATDQMRRQFEREIEAAATLSHPNIVSVFAVDTIDGQPALAMEWIDGVSISDWAEGRELQSVLRLFVKVCQAVHHAHQRGVIHRDLKPSNVLVTIEDNEARSHVLDFGLAKMMTGLAGEESAGSFAGTPGYASPEQLAGRADEIDIRTDIYSLGVILYRLLTGRMPYPDDAPPAEGLRAIRETAPPSPSSLKPGLDTDLDAIALKALSAAREDRYQSVAALADDLQRHGRGEPVEAHPRTRRYLVKKFVARHRAACAAAAFAALVLIVFTAALAEALRREAESRAVAQQVSAFLQETLSAAGPARGGGDVTLLETMTEAAKRAQRELTARPRVAAEVFLTIGSTYVNLWRAREAVPYLRNAVELNRAEYGPSSEALARSLCILGRALSNSSDPGAVAVQREALAIREANFGPNHPLTAESKMRLGYALFRAQRPPQFDEAEALLADALATDLRVLGPRHREVASCLHNIGYMRLCQGRVEEAEEIYREAMGMLRDSSGTEDPYYVECLHGYTSILMTLKRYDEAAAALDEAIPLVQAMYGREQGPYLLWRRARANRQIGRLDEAQRDLALAIGGTLRLAADGVTNDPGRQLRLMDLAERATLSAADPAIGVPADRLLLSVEELGSNDRDLRGLLHDLVLLRREQGDAAAADELASGLAAISARRRQNAE